MSPTCAAANFILSKGIGSEARRAVVLYAVTNEIVGRIDAIDAELRGLGVTVGARP
jgi:hypothetical protein